MKIEATNWNNKRSLHTDLHDYHQKDITNVGEDVKKLEPSHTTTRNVKWCSCFVIISTPLKLKHGVTACLRNSIPRHIPKRYKNVCHIKKYMQMFIAALFTVEK